MAACETPIVVEWICKHKWHHSIKTHQEIEYGCNYDMIRIQRKCYAIKPTVTVTDPVPISRYAYMYLMHMFRVFNICSTQEFHTFINMPSFRAVHESSFLKATSVSAEECQHSVHTYDSYELDECGPSQVKCDDSTCVLHAHVCASDFTCKPSLCWCTVQGIHVKNSNYCSKECTPGKCQCALFMFQCSHGCIPMWQVCDGWSHCRDSSDEFCIGIQATSMIDLIYSATREVLGPLITIVAGYDLCLGYRCLSGLCISHALVNDLIPDCPGYEAEDEIHALNIKLDGIGFKCSRPGHIPCAMNHSKCYDLKKLCMYDHDNLNNMAFCRNGAHLWDCSWVECTNTFKCHQSYCIPFHKVCDGIADCVDGDDEISCGNYICTGLMKCQGNPMCVHPVEVCDNVQHCPAGDDETLCHLQQCPLHCECLAYSIICRKPYLKYIPNLGSSGYRYLSANFLAIKSPNFVNISSQSDLIILDLASTGIKIICSSFKIYCRFYKTLSVLNLANNSITYLETGCFNPLVYLVHLDLKDNPLVFFSESSLRLDNIRIVDLGNTFMVSFYGVSFEYLQQLQVLDLRGVLLSYVDAEADTFLNHLPVIITDDYRLCCIYPAIPGCFNITNPFKYCTRVLPRQYFAPALIIIGIFMIMINLVGLISHNVKFFHDKPTYNAIVSIMAVTEMVKASYFVIIAVVDLYHSSHYVLLGRSWAESIFCRLLMISHAAALATSICVNIMLHHLRYLAVAGVNFFLEDHGRRVRLFLLVTPLLVLSLFTAIVVSEKAFTTVPHSSTGWCLFASYYDNKNSVMFVGVVVLGLLMLCSLSHTVMVYTLICIKVFRITRNILVHTPGTRSYGYLWRLVKVMTKGIKVALVQTAVCFPLMYLIMKSLAGMSTSQESAFLIITVPFIVSGCLYPTEFLLLNVFHSSNS